MTKFSFISSKARLSNFSSFARSLLLGTSLLGLAACQTMTGGNMAEGIGFREARFQEVAAMNSYRDCRADALALDEQARLEGSVEKYLASARLIEKCESNVGPQAKNLSEDERMRTYALSVLNYVRGGDLTAAAENLEQFQTHFPGKDLYFSDKSSFIATMQVLTGQKENESYTPGTLQNVNRDLRKEKRRIQHWLTS